MNFYHYNMILKVSFKFFSLPFYYGNGVWMHALIFCFIYLFIRHIPYPTTAGSACSNVRKRDKKDRTKKNRIGAKSETIHPDPGRKQKEEQKKEIGSGPPTQLPGPFGRHLQPTGIIRWAYSVTLPRAQVYIIIKE